MITSNFIWDRVGCRSISCTLTPCNTKHTLLHKLCKCAWLVQCFVFKVPRAYNTIQNKTLTKKKILYINNYCTQQVFKLYAQSRGMRQPCWWQNQKLWLNNQRMRSRLHQQAVSFGCWCSD